MSNTSKNAWFCRSKKKTLYKSLVKHMFRNSSVLSVKKCFDSKLFSKMKFAVVFLVLAFVTFASAIIIGDGARASANIIADGVEDGVLNINENAKRDFKDSLNNLKDIRNETDLSELPQFKRKLHPLSTIQRNLWLQTFLTAFQISYFKS